MVEFLQNILKMLGFYNGEIDGTFGNATKKAVIKFQNDFRLTADGIVGFRTWNALQPYIDGRLGFIVPTNISYSSSILKINLDSLKKLYPFIEIENASKSVLGTDIPVVKIGTGQKQVFYSASFHANEWICYPLIMKFLADYCYTYVNNLNIFNINARSLYNSCTIYIMPMVNPDGIGLIFTGYFLYLF